MTLPAPALGEPYLLTPGPLTTAYEVKQAMLKDWGSWDADFRAMTADLRARLLALLGDAAGYECVPMQGSGTFCVEAMLGTLVPRNVRVAEAPSYGLPVLVYDPRSKGALAHVALAGEMLRRHEKRHIA